MDILLTAAAQGNPFMITIVYIAVIGVFFYIAMVRPQRKEQDRMRKLMENLAVGDSVLTNSGFYGIVIDITEDTVILEFGNNKNCRIPMQKSAISQVEKPYAAAEPKDDKAKK